MSSKCLHNEYVILHGTALGAMRNQTILPHTEDVDLGLTPLAHQFLELNSTREELWRYGYALLFFTQTHHAPARPGFWKVRPHLHHPDPAFRAAFRSYGEDYKDWRKRHDYDAAGFIDLWPMWRVPSNTTSCTIKQGMDITCVQRPWPPLGIQLFQT